MTETLVSFETAKLAKEKGFDEFCNSWYEEDTNNNTYSADDYNKYCNTTLTFENQYSAPTQSLLQKWLREKYRIYFTHKFVFTRTPREQINLKYSIWYTIVSNPILQEDIKGWLRPIEGVYDTYEEALEQGLQETLKLI